MAFQTKHDWGALMPQISALAAQNKNLAEISAATGIAGGTIWYQAKRHGVAIAKTPCRPTKKGAARPIQYRPQRGRMAALNYLPPSELMIDPAYQRSIEGQESQTLIRRIAANWDWSLCLPLVVSARDNGERMFVIDGQHRLEAARLRGDIHQLPCVVVATRSCEEEAALFEQINAQRRALTALELFQASVASGDPDAAAIERALADAGLMLAPHSNPKFWQPGMIGNIGGIRSAWKIHGSEVTSAALVILAEAFAGQVLRYAGSIFPGIVTAVAGDRTDGLTALLAGRSQEHWRSAMLEQRAKDPGVNYAKAAERAIEHEWRAANRAESRHKADPVKFASGQAWCNQCDMKRSLVQAEACTSRFCKLKTTA